MTGAAPQWRRHALKMPDLAPTLPAGAEVLTVVIYADGGLFLDVLAGIDAGEQLHTLGTILKRRQDITP